MIQNFTKAGFAEELFTSRDFRDDAFRQILGPVFSVWAKTGNGGPVTIKSLG